MKKNLLFLAFFLSASIGFGQAKHKHHHIRKDTLTPPPVTHYDTVARNTTQNGDETIPPPMAYSQDYSNRPDTAPKTYVETMPQFPGGMDAMYSFIKRTVKYPEIAKEAGIEETIYMKFVVDTTGTICRIEVAKGRDKSLIAEATRCLKQMPKWTPGRMNGKVVNVYFTLPFRFRFN